MGKGGGVEELTTGLPGCMFIIFHLFCLFFDSDVRVVIWMSLTNESGSRKRDRQKSEVNGYGQLWHGVIPVNTHVLPLVRPADVRQANVRKEKSVSGGLTSATSGWQTARWEQPSKMQTRLASFDRLSWPISGSRGQIDSVERLWGEWRVSCGPIHPKSAPTQGNCWHKTRGGRGAAWNPDPTGTPPPPPPPLLKTPRSKTGQRGVYRADASRGNFRPRLHDKTVLVSWLISGRLTGDLHRLHLIAITNVSVSPQNCSLGRFCWLTVI